MPSTPLAYPQVISRRFTCFRVVKFSITAGQLDLCAEFDSRQLHNEICISTGVFTPRFAPRGHILGTPRNKIVHLVSHVIKVIGEQMPVLIERHSRRFMA